MHEELVKNRENTKAIPKEVTAEGEYSFTGKWSETLMRLLLLSIY